MMNPNMNMRPGIILLKDGTDTSQVRRLLKQAFAGVSFDGVSLTSI